MPGTILIGVDVETASENSKTYTERGAELFAREGVPATWYVTGQTLEKYPDEFVRVEKQAKHIDLQSHTYEHMLLKTVLIEVPPGRTIHGKTDWVLVQGGSNEAIDQSLGKCQQLFRDILGRPALGLTGPWGYYRGLSDRPDLLDIVHRHGFRFLRTWARNEKDGQPVPLERQPFFYNVQGFSDILEMFVHDYQDDFYFIEFNGLKDASTYPVHLRKMCDRVAAKNLVWSLATHDHSCQTASDFAAKTAWLVELMRYAKSLGIRFLTGSTYHAERAAR